MIFKAAFPALVTARPPRRPTPTRCVFRMETELDFPEVSSEEAPVVMTFHGRYNHEVENWGGPVPVRMIGDRHYIPLISTERFERALLEPFPSLAYSTVPHFRFIKDIHKPIRKRLFADLEGNGGLITRPWPSRIEHLLRDDSSSHIFHAEAKTFASSGGKLSLDDHAVAESERARDFFMQGFAGFAVLDGVVWRPVPEPCFRVDANSALISAVIPHGLSVSPYTPSDAEFFTSSSHFFAADQMEEAKAFSKSLGKDRFALEMLEITEDGIDIVDEQGLLGHDYVAAGLYVTAREMLSSLRDFPSVDVEATMLELRQAFEASNGGLDVSPDLEQAVRNAVALEDVDFDWYNRRIDVETAKRIQLQLDRQDTRPIDVSLKAPRL
ncbi:hypothetical protein O9X98_07050 [Agrobacterium salinitolerans]|nr:hypothetical protein [Agrobacterium salinitolerans]